MCEIISFENSCFMPPPPPLHHRLRVSTHSLTHSLIYYTRSLVYLVYSRCTCFWPWSSPWIFVPPLTNFLQPMYHQSEMFLAAFLHLLHPVVDDTRPGQYNSCVLARFYNLSFSLVLPLLPRIFSRFCIHQFPLVPDYRRYCSITALKRADTGSTSLQLRSADSNPSKKVHNTYHHLVVCSFGVEQYYHNPLDWPVSYSERRRRTGRHCFLFICFYENTRVCLAGLSWRRIVGNTNFQQLPWKPNRFRRTESHQEFYSLQ